jgi:hypothetical protein
MPYTATEPSLPFSGREPLARQHSYLAAQAASRTRGPKLQAMIDFFKTHRQCTDEGLAEGLFLPRSSVCSLRNALVDRGQVRAVGRTTGRWGHAITIWEWVG